MTTSWPVTPQPANSSSKPIIRSGDSPGSGETVRVRFSSQNSSSDVSVTKASHIAGPSGLESWMYDVLATLRRSGEPYELTAGDLMRDTMVTTGAFTNRIDRLEQRGLVERATSEDRRKVIVRRR